jgi:hypothetical protein
MQMLTYAGTVANHAPLVHPCWVRPAHPRPGICLCCVHTCHTHPFALPLPCPPSLQPGTSGLGIILLTALTERQWVKEDDLAADLHLHAKMVRKAMRYLEEVRRHPWCMVRVEVWCAGLSSQAEGPLCTSYGVTWIRGSSPSRHGSQSASTPTTAACADAVTPDTVPAAFVPADPAPARCM